MFDQADPALLAHRLCRIDVAEARGIGRAPVAKLHTMGVESGADPHDHAWAKILARSGASRRCDLPHGAGLTRIAVLDQPAARGQAPQIRVREDQVPDLPALELFADRVHRDAGGP